MAPPMTGTPPLLYVVDDDAEICRLIQQHLGKHDFEVIGLPTADEMLRRLARRRPALTILDVMMPGTGGLEALRKLREDGDDLPLILLTARSAEQDRIVGLDLGADDYLAKPFSVGELLSRVRAVLRRRTIPPTAAPEPGKAIRIGNFVLDPLTRTLSRDGKAIDLMLSDFVLLHMLASHPLKPLSRDRLLEMTGTHGADKLERSIDAQIVRLRRLIEADPRRPKILQTVRGVGYVFVPH
jgi:DNA-binding response OmpR family regulator